MAIKTHTGFTLIELLIVVTLSGLLILAAVSLFFTTITGNEKTSSSLLVKQNGDYAITQLSRLIRSSRNATCPSGSELVLIGNDGGTTTVRQIINGQNSQLASNSGLLTGTDVYLTTVSFSCINPSDGAPSYVKASFTLQKGASGDSGYVLIPFDTSVSLRSY